MHSSAAIEQFAGKGAARAARRRLKGGGGVDARPRWWNYAVLAVVLGIALFPLYYALLLASSDAGGGRGRYPDPGGHHQRGACRQLSAHRGDGGGEGRRDRLRALEAGDERGGLLGHGGQHQHSAGVFVSIHHAARVDGRGSLGWVGHSEAVPVAAVRRQ